MSNEPVPRPTRALFRQEAIDAQREKLLGELSTVRPVPMWVFTALSVAFAAVFVVFVSQFIKGKSPFFWGKIGLVIFPGLDG